MLSIKSEEDKLNSPVWHSLNETHQPFKMELSGMFFYSPAYCIFGAALNNNTVKGIEDYARISERLFIVGERPNHSPELGLKKVLVCDQLLLRKPIDIEIKESIVPLTQSQQKSDLYHLVQEVQPGYFRPKIADLGRYFGIYKKGVLVAATGERMKMNAFTEISAIVTHPHHRGKSYATQLIKQSTDLIFAENKLPYLHVAESNTPAIRLYKNLGFTERKKIRFWLFTKN